MYVASTFMHSSVLLKLCYNVSVNSPLRINMVTHIILADLYVMLLDPQVNSPSNIISLVKLQLHP